MLDEIQETLEYLYAPVWPDKTEEVLAQGLNSNDDVGFMLVNRDTYAIGFINITGGVRLNGVTEFVFDGKNITAPAFDKFVTGVAIKIRMSDLDSELLTECNEDFSSDFYPANMRCFTYAGSVSASSIVGHVEYKLSSPDIPMRP